MELNGDYEKAILYHKLSIKNAPFEVALYLNLSNALKQNNKLEDALNFLHIAKILSLADKSIDYEIAQLNTKLKKYSKADLIYKELIKDKNIKNEIIFSYCDNLIKNKQENIVLEFLEKYSKTYSSDDNYHLTLGLAYLKKRKYNFAKTCFLNSIKINPNNNQSYNLLGDYYLAISDIKNAKINYEKSLKILPNNNIALKNLAAMSFFKGDLEEAEQIYNLAIKNNKNDYDAMYYLSQCQLARCNYQKGWKNFESRWLANNFESKKLKTNIPKFFLNSDNKNVLVWSEQGLGDQILFLRFLNNLIPYVDNIYINIDSRLHKIIKRMNPKIHFVNNVDQIKENNINSQIPIEI